MAGKKPVTASRAQSILKRRAKKRAAGEKKRAEHYGKGDKLIRKVSSTLQALASSHPSPAGKKRANLALKQLQQAHTAFGDACLCQSSQPTFNQDES